MKQRGGHYEENNNRSLFVVDVVRVFWFVDQAISRGKLSHNDLVIYVLDIYHGLLPYFCPPDMPLTGENLIDILDKTLEENKWFVEKVPNVALSYPLQIGLINTFPCKD